MLYYHAEIHNFAVIGTPPRNEHDLGFFVKYGDSAMDVKPIAHLYKTQVYQLARHLGVPNSVLGRPPTTDTYTAGNTQEEFFFRIPFETLDLLLYAWENGVPPSEAAPVLELTEEQVQRAFADFAQKVQTTKYLRTTPLGLRDP